MASKEVFLNAKTKNTCKYDYFPGFLLYLKNAYFTDHWDNKKVKKELRVRTKLSVDVIMPKTLTNYLRYWINFIQNFCPFAPFT